MTAAPNFNLSEFDHLFSGSPRPSKLPTPMNGRYQICLSDGEAIHLRVYTKNLKSRWVPGQRLIEIIREDNEPLTFGFVHEVSISVFKKFHGKTRDYEGIAKIFCDLTAEVEVPDCEILTATANCLACNHPLSDPESLRTGYGRSCRKGL